MARNNCIFEGQDYQLIEAGIYEAVYQHYETSRNFSVRGPGPKRLQGGKLYLWFLLDPYGNQGLSLEGKILLFMAFNCKAVGVPCGKSGQFFMGRRSSWAKLCKRLQGEFKIPSTGSPNEFKERLFTVSVRTVTKDQKQRGHAEHDQYSVIDEIVGLA